MIEFRSITEEDIPNLEYQKLDWDVDIKGIPYQIIKVPGFVHTIGGHLDHGDGNCLWAYPLDEEMSYENIIQFDGHPGARWGFEYYPTNYVRNKYDDTSIEAGRHLVITRNNEKFYDGFMTIHDCLAYVLDHKLDDHPLELNSRDFDKKCIGRKVWYRRQPAYIAHYCKGQASVILKPDGVDKFVKPAEWEDDFMWDEENAWSIKVSIFSNWINWFREVR